MSRVLRKPDFCICENIGADQLCSKCTADQRLSFRYTDSTMTLLPGLCRTGLCRTCWETQIVGFLMKQLTSLPILNRGCVHVLIKCTAIVLIWPRGLVIRSSDWSNNQSSLTIPSAFFLTLFLQEILKEDVKTCLLYFVDFKLLKITTICSNCFDN